MPPKKVATGLASKVPPATAAAAAASKNKPRQTSTSGITTINPNGIVEYTDDEVKLLRAIMDGQFGADVGLNANGSSSPVQLPRAEPTAAAPPSESSANGSPSNSSRNGTPTVNNSPQLSFGTAASAQWTSQVLPMLVSMTRKVLVYAKSQHEAALQREAAASDKQGSAISSDRGGSQPQGSPSTKSGGSPFFKVGNDTNGNGDSKGLLPSTASVVDDEGLARSGVPAPQHESLVEFEEENQYIIEQLEYMLAGQPFTLRRLCEILADPQRYNMSTIRAKGSSLSRDGNEAATVSYLRAEKLQGAIRKCVLVTVMDVPPAADSPTNTV